MSREFRLWLEKNFTGITPDTLEWWAKYARHMIFKTPEEAREWVFNRRERTDRDPSQTALFGVDGPEYNRAFANALPLYQSGKSWKIGKRIRNDNRLRLGHLEVKKPDMEELHMVATSNTSYDWDYGGIKWLRISDLIGEGTDDYYFKQEMGNLKDLAWRIKTSMWIEAVIVGMDGKDVELWEGQHRTRAMRLLGFSTVPCYVIKIL